MVPATSPGGKPVMEMPGATPRSPPRTLGPVLVTVDAPRTAKGVAVPSGASELMGSAFMKAGEKDKKMPRETSAELLCIGVTSAHEGAPGGPNEKKILNLAVLW